MIEEAETAKTPSAARGGRLLGDDIGFLYFVLRAAICTARARASPAATVSKYPVLDPLFGRMETYSQEYASN